MSLVGGWVLAPLVLIVVCCGAGLLAERVARVRLPGTLVPAVGLAVVIVVAGICTIRPATAPLATFTVAYLAFAGVVLARPWRDDRLRSATPWALLALAAFAIHGVPSLLSGQGSITGYIRLDDSPTWIATVDRALGHARDFAGVAPGSYERTLASWLGTDYPLGSFLPVGVTAALSGQDAVNVYQPVIAVMMSILALAMAACLRPLLSSRALVAAAALVAVQASLLLGYSQWGAIKEVCAAVLLAPAAWLAVRGGRELALLCVVVAALCGVLGLSGMAWGAPALLVAALVAVGRWPGRDALRGGMALGALLVVALLPALTTLDFFKEVTSSGGTLFRPGEKGNLVAPLPLLQGLGLWPAGDFRFDPDPRRLAVALALVVAVTGLAAIAWAARRRALEIPALVAIGLTGTSAAVVVGTPWVDAKALAITCAIPLLAAAAGCAMALESTRVTRRALGAVGAVALVLGCSWSTYAVFVDVQVAPRERLAELRDLGRAIAGRGPTVQLDFDVYGDRWFLRKAATDGATDLRLRHVRGYGGRDFPEGSNVEVDDVVPGDLFAYRIVVRRRSPVASRPPSAFRRIWAGDAWEAWERPADAAAPLRRLPAGSADGPAAPIACSQIAELARTPGARTLAAVAPRRAPVVADLAAGTVPARWTAAGMRPVVDGEATTSVRLPGGARWRVWVRGSVLGALEVTLDGRSLGTLRHELSHGAQWLRFGATEVGAGTHTLALRYRRGGFWRAGRGTDEAQLGLGQVLLTSDDGAPAVTRVAVRDYRRLCRGEALDWVEAIGG